MTRTHIGRRHIRLDATDSTNNRAAEFAVDPAFAGTVVTAGVQSQGRGQYGRIWQSRPGECVLLSALLFPPPELRRPALLTAFATVAVCATVQSLLARKPTIKWPNDVMLDGKKVCGILTECGVHAGSEPYFVIGIGLNVNLTGEDLFAMDLPDATSLAIAAGSPQAVREIEEQMIDVLDAHYGQILVGGIADLEERWVQRLNLTETIVTVQRMDTTEIRGRLTGLSFDDVSVELPGGAVCRLRPEEVRKIVSGF